MLGECSLILRFPSYSGQRDQYSAFPNRMEQRRHPDMQKSCDHDLEEHAVTNRVRSIFGVHVGLWQDPCHLEGVEQKEQSEKQPPDSEAKKNEDSTSRSIMQVPQILPTPASRASQNGNKNLVVVLAKRRRYR